MSIDLTAEEFFTEGTKCLDIAMREFEAEMTKAVESRNVATVAEKFVSWKLQFEEFEKFYKEVAAQNDKFKSELVPSVFQDPEGGAKTITTNSGYRVTVTNKIYASAKGDAKKEAKDWLLQNNHEYVIVESVNASSLSSLAKELAEKNEQLPEDLFNQFTKSGMSVTKVKTPKK